jgi:hypothetical protein
MNREKYMSLSIFKITHAQILKITDVNGMRMSNYIKELVAKDFKRLGYTEADLPGEKK